MIIRELIERVIHDYEEGMPSDDTRLSNRRVYSALQSVGAKFMKQRLDRNHKISDFQYTFIDCIELQCSVVPECDCLPAGLGFKYWKSVEEVPEILSSRRGLAVKHIGTIEGRKYTQSSFEMMSYLDESSPWTANEPRWFIKNRHLFVRKQDRTKVISMSAIVADPVQAAMMKTKCNTDGFVCNPMDLYFNLIDISQEEDLIKTTVNKLVQMENMRLEDRTNDASNVHIQKAK